MKKIYLILFFIFLIFVITIKVNASTTDYINILDSTNATLEIPTESMTCEEILGQNLKNVLHLFINAIRIGSAIVAVLLCMTALIPPIMSDDAKALKKATNKCIKILIMLALIQLLPVLVRVVGLIAGFDLSCL